MSYSPPLTFNFEIPSAPATSPITADFVVVGETQLATPQGFNDLLVGLAEIRNAVEVIAAPGVGPAAFGTLEIGEFTPRELFPVSIRGVFGTSRLRNPIPLEFAGFGFSPDPPPVRLDFQPGGDRFAFLQGFKTAQYGLGVVANRDQGVAGIGIAELAFGQHVAYLGQQWVTPAGFSAFESGLQVVENWVRLLFPTGISALAVGQPLIENASLGIFASGWDSLVIGPAEAPHAIAYYIGQLEPTGFTQLAFGTQFVAYAIRAVAASPVAGAAFGAAEFTNYTRTVNAIGFRTDEFGVSAVGTSTEVFPLGFESLQFGEHEGRDNRQTVPPPSITGEFGLAMIRRAFERIRPDPAAFGEQWGDVGVFNRIQQVEVFWPPDFVAGPVSAPVVSLQDREVFPQGFDALRFPFLGPSVANGPPPIQATLGRTDEWGFALVAPRVRSVTMIGRTQEEFSSPIVSNAARNFTPEPFTATLYGTPAVVNLLQFTAETGAIGELSFGLPFVAPRVRTLIPTGVFLFEAGAQHRVSRSPQAAEPFGISGQLGLAFVANRPVRLIEVRQDLPGTVERPSIANRNRRVFPLGFLNESYGIPQVENYIREVRPLGFDSFASDTHEITDRVRTIRPFAMRGAIGNHRARLFPEPILPQSVFTQGFEAWSIGDASVRANSIFPPGFTQLAFGEHLVRGNTIAPRGWISLDMADTRPSVSADQYVYLGPTDALPNMPSNGIAPPDWDLPNVPRITPFTIWAPDGAPQQADDNHPPGGGEPIGIITGIGSPVPGGIVEPPFVSNYLRTVFPLPVNFASPTSQRGVFGVPGVSQFVVEIIRPSGFRGRWGFPFALGGDLGVIASGFLSEQFGLASVSRRATFSPNLIPQGFIATLWGEAFISNNPHDILPQGFLATQMGGGTGGSGGLWVSNEYPPFPAIGFEATLWGAARVSRNPETIHPFGWDSFTDDNVLITDRMRVRARAIVAPFGATTERFGAARVEDGTRTIQAFSVFKQGVPAPRIQPVARAAGIAPPTIDAPVVDQVEAGILKAKGSDSAEIGHAIVSAAIRVPGLAGEFGATAVYNRLAPESWRGEFGGVLVAGSADHTCGMQTRGVRHVWTEAEAIGIAEVANG